MNTPALENEVITKEGPTNLLRGVESVGGKLYLTNQRLIFESHSVNFQTGATIFNLVDVKSTKTTWTKFLGAIPTFPNGLDVELNDGNLYHFTVYGRRKWKDALGK